MPKLVVERRFKGCEEQKFHRSESSTERKFLGFSLPGSECSTERKFHGSESSLYGLFAPGNESAEERKGQLPGKIQPRIFAFYISHALFNFTHSHLCIKIRKNEHIIYELYRFSALKNLVPITGNKQWSYLNCNRDSGVTNLIDFQV